MNYYIGNAFSLNMVPEHCVALIDDLTESQAIACYEENYPESIVGHEDMAKIMNSILVNDLNHPAIVFNRETVCLEGGDKILVAQYSGERLPEGSRNIPDGAKIRWVLVEIR